MEYEIISYSFVGIWQTPMVRIPMLDNKFCKDLFGDPYRTDAAVMPDGLFITMASRVIPSPIVQVGQQKILVITPTLETTVDTLVKLKTELSTKEFNLELKSYGINFEFELTIEENAIDFLANNFVFKNLQINNKEGIKIYPTDINFTILNGETEKFVILIQPRLNKEKALFLSINCHNEKALPSLPSKEEISTTFDDTIKYIENNIFKALFNYGN